MEEIAGNVDDGDESKDEDEEEEEEEEEDDESRLGTINSRL